MMVWIYCNAIMLRIAVKSIPNPYESHTESIQIHTQYIESKPNQCQIDAKSMRNPQQNPCKIHANPYQIHANPYEFDAKSMQT